MTCGVETLLAVNAGSSSMDIGQGLSQSLSAAC